MTHSEDCDDETGRKLFCSRGTSQQSGKNHISNPSSRKGSYDAPRFYRLIALRSCVGKLIERVMARRLKPFSKEKGARSYQINFAARSPRPTSDALLTLAENPRYHNRPGTQMMAHQGVQAGWNGGQHSGRMGPGWVRQQFALLEATTWTLLLAVACTSSSGSKLRR